MIKKPAYIIFSFFTALMLFGCASIYTPTTPNIPLFKNKNELQVEITHFTNGNNLKAAYTPVKHIAIQANGELSMLFNQHQYLEGALGTYWCLKNKAIIELYGGYGHGNSNWGDPQDGSDYKLTMCTGKYEKFYGQLNVGTCDFHGWQMGISIRAGNVRYTYEHTQFSWLTNTTVDHTCIEPYFFVNRNLGKHFSFVSHLGVTDIEGIKKTMRTNVINAGFGFRFYLGKKVE